MPAAQLFGAAIETSLNHLLKLDGEAAAQLKPIKGKQLMICLHELPWPMVFCFSDRIDLIIPDADQNTQPDCKIALSLSSLNTLQDTSQLTRLIQQDKLQLDGDLSVAQGFSGMLKSIDIDWQEQLSRYTGDVATHSLFGAGKTFISRVGAALDNARKVLSETALEEKPIAAHPLMVSEFCVQVNELRSDSARLEARLALLETHRDSADKD